MTPLEAILLTIVTASTPLLIAALGELVAERAGVRWVDDSKATNPHATLSAVQGMEDVVLIAGGRSKGIDLSVLSGAVPPVIGVVALGEAHKEVAAAFAGLVEVRRAVTMSEAVGLARDLAVVGGSVLLSPGCASLDMYSGYAERGEDFARAVRNQATEAKREVGDGDG
jgi:UDP-N-acetylmuramoylalanine--D-glutamate ligase